MKEIILNLTLTEAEARRLLICMRDTRLKASYSGISMQYREEYLSMATKVIEAIEEIGKEDA